jgi:site-specific DNA-methyltransferase (adenine-specific)
VKEKGRAPRNRTITLSEAERVAYGAGLARLTGAVALTAVRNRTIHQDLFTILDWLPAEAVDLLVADPPYNLSKSFNGRAFSPLSLDEYEQWLAAWLLPLKRTLKPTAALYVCGDWRSAAAIQRVLTEHFVLRNRITWEREKGRGSQRNWKSCAEDIWFATVGEQYTFNLEAVKVQRRVLAPYTQGDGQPKDWAETDNGRYRLTHPANIWTDITVPFWSMPENTDHPTQKPEKLLAKLILASSNPGDVVLDPFLGSGTTSVVARKLGRDYVGVEIDETYACLAEKRLALAQADSRIQGYEDGVFWERNSHYKGTKGLKEQRGAGDDFPVS